ncbi:MAG: lysophospholipid acyltransferase family protein [Deltaproteobacteria bacterium]|nr:lysophospholipid acyltransferase family protein [Deltaproteobacteria bacterium]
MALLRAAIGLLLGSMYWLMSRLWSYAHINRPAHTNGALYAHWHGDELLLIGAYAHSRMAVMVSTSRDGQMLNTMLKLLGYYVVRGSSTRGAVGGLKGLIDNSNKKDCSASLAVDGPRGPVYRVKPGILKLAQMTSRPIIPGAAAASRRYIFKKAWNRCYLPWPFSKCIVIYGKPVWVDKELSDEALEALRFQLEEQMISLKVEAERYFDRSLDYSPVAEQSTI